MVVALVVFGTALQLVTDWLSTGELTAAALLGAVVAVALAFLPSWLAPDGITKKERFDAENSTRQLILQIAGVIAVGGTLLSTLARVDQAERTLTTTQEQGQATSSIAQEGQITERFTRAVEHLGSDNLEIRLGGIYALERIARDSVRDHWPVWKS